MGVGVVVEVIVRARPASTEERGRAHLRWLAQSSQEKRFVFSHSVLRLRGSLCLRGRSASKTWLTSVSAPGACLSCNIARQRIASLFIIWMMHRRLPYAGLAFYGIEHTTGEFVVHETAPHHFCRLPSDVCNASAIQRDSKRIPMCRMSA